jgi:hypothetical protein
MVCQTEAYQMASTTCCRNKGSKNLDIPGQELTAGVTAALLA